MRLVVGSQVETLLHGKREVLVRLVGDKGETVEQAALGVLEHVVELLEEQLLASFHVLGLDVRLDRETGQVNRVEREVAAARGLFGAVDIAEHPGTASHGRNCCILDNLLDGYLVTLDFGEFPVVAYSGIVLVDEPVKLHVGKLESLEHVLAADLDLDFAFGNLDFLGLVLDVREVERAVHADEVRVETACEALDGVEVQVVVRVFWIFRIALQELEDEDRENGGKAVAEAFHLGLDEVLADHAAAVGCVEAKVQGRERYLVAGARLQGIEIADEAFHSLVRIVVGRLYGLVDAYLRELRIQELCGHVHGNRVNIGEVDVLVLGIVLEIADELGLEVLPEGNIDERLEVEVEVVVRDSAVLLVGLELENDGRERGRGLDRLRRAEVAGTGVETRPEQFADRGEETVERQVVLVEIMDMQMAVLVFLRVLPVDVVEQVVHLVRLGRNLAVRPGGCRAGLVGVVS